MLPNRLELPIEVKNSTKIYSLRHKLRGQGSLGVTLKKIRSASETDYKLIHLNLIGRIKGKRKRIKKVQNHLSFYNQNKAVPNLIFSDSDNLLLEWVDGIRFDRIDKDQSDYEQLAEFNASNVTDTKKIPVQPLLDKRINQVRSLNELNFIDDQLEKEILKCFENKNILNSDFLIESLCFADSALKNYVKKKDGTFAYIDVFGINRRHIGRVFIKQLTQIPLEYRSAYSDTFKRKLSKNIVTSLAFSLLNYFITRLYSNATKRKFTNYKRRNSKTEETLTDLKSFLETVKNGASIEDWVFSHTF